MTAQPERELVVIPLKILRGQALDEDLAGLLAAVNVFILGYHVVPEQTAPAQMRQQFEAQALNALDAIEESIHAVGGNVDSRLLFTHDAEQSIERVADEIDATSLALANPCPPVETILVPLRGDVDALRIGTFVSRIRADREIEVTLFAAAREARVDAVEGLVEAAAGALAANGVPSRAITRRTETTSHPVEAIIEAAIQHDVTVMGEREPDWRSLVFGDLEDRVAAESLGPVLVVRRYAAGADG